MSKYKAGTPIIKPVDTPEMIEYCLNCPWDKCWDCLGQKSAYSQALRFELGGGLAVNGRNVGYPTLDDMKGD